MSDKNSQNKDLIVVEAIADKIHFIRGQRVMLDSDLAEVYQVETRVLKQAVRRNLHRFPPDFMFELSLEETRHIESLRSQTVTLDAAKSKRGKYSKYTSFVFTEHGAVMLASVLKSQIAVDASIQVVRAFVQVRTILMLHKDLAERIEELELAVDKHAEKFEVISHLLAQILGDKKRVKRPIGFIDKQEN